MIPKLPSLVFPILVVAHTDVQLKLFVENNDLEPKNVRRIREVRDLRGYRTTNQPILFLPGCHETPYWGRLINVIQWWLDRGGKTLEITEAQVLGYEREDGQ